jgi:hypothetical protein
MSIPFYLRQPPTPKNDPAEWLSGFENEKQVAERYKARGKLMFTGNTTSQPNFYWCAEASPCDSAACPPCMREFRRWLVDAGITLFEQLQGQLSVASLVHYSWSRSPGNLKSVDLDKAKRQMRRHFDRAGLGSLVAIGGFDFSFNQPTTEFTPYCQPHVYVIVQGTQHQELKRALTPFYPSTAEIPRPIRTRRVTDPMEAFSYTAKAIFFRRVSYRDRSGRANTQTLPLLPSAERELLAYLDQLHPVDRLFLKNVRRQGAILVPKLEETYAPSSVPTISLSTAEASSRSLSPKKTG